MFFAGKKVLGIDVGASSIKMAELNVGRKGTVMSSFASIPTPADAVQNGEIVNPEAIAHCIVSLVEELGTKRTKGAIGMSGAGVIVKKITMPRMEAGLIGEQLHWEAEQYIPYDVNEVNLSYELLEGSNSADSMDVLLIAAVQESVFRYAEAVELAGIECYLVDVNGFALANAFEANYGVIGGEVVTLMNIGASATNFVVVENGEVVFCRDIPVGGNTYTNEVQRGLGISREEAEGMKISACTGLEVPPEVISIVQNTHDLVVDEINSSVDFFLNTSNASTINRGFVTGGCTRVPGLVEQLSKIVAFERMNPLLRVRCDEKTMSRDYADQIRDFASVVVGLGIRQVGDS
ncbi:MAG: type IV pilus assembly protein PilM [Bdellovibrionales bacterium]|nr:type IV pilus assembly protein PilM [Bdellovibrionales bacterium]